jgi:hypothetical protein
MAAGILHVAHAVELINSPSLNMKTMVRTPSEPMLSWRGIPSTSSTGVWPTVSNRRDRTDTHGRCCSCARRSKKVCVSVHVDPSETDPSADEFELDSTITALVLKSYLVFNTLASSSKGLIYLFDLQLPRVARNREPVA